MIFRRLNHFMSVAVLHLLVCFVLFLPFVPCSEAGTSSRVITPDSLQEKIRNTVGGQFVVMTTPARFGEMMFRVLDGGNAKQVKFVISGRFRFDDEMLKQWTGFISRNFPGDEKTVRRHEGGGFFATVAGVETTILPIERWKGEGTGALLVIDLPFIVSLFVDETRSPFPDLPGAVIKALDERKIDIGAAVLFLADRSDLPLDREYLVTLSEEAFSDPKRFKEELPAPWTHLRSGENLVFVGLLTRAADRFELFLKERTNEVSVLYRLALGRLLEGETEMGLRYLHSAADKDPYFSRGFAGASFSLYVKERYDEAERVLRAGLHREPNDPDLKTGLARVTFAQAKKMIPFDREGAEVRYSEIGKIGIEQEMLKGFDTEWTKALSDPIKIPGMPGNHSVGAP